MFGDSWYPKQPVSFNGCFNWMMNFKPLHGKFFGNHQTSTLNWLFGVPSLNIIDTYDPKSNLVEFTLKYTHLVYWCFWNIILSLTEIS